jgi:hypothetical protein
MKVEKLTNAFNEMFDFITDLPSGLDGFESDFDEAYEELKNIQSDNVQEVRHAKWIRSKESDRRECSLCGKIYFSKTINFNYCSDCGAKMDEE